MMNRYYIVLFALSIVLVNPFGSDRILHTTDSHCYPQRQVDPRRVQLKTEIVSFALFKTISLERLKSPIEEFTLYLKLR